MALSEQTMLPERGALQGIRVLEVDTGLAQYAGRLFAELGAEVIKVEPLGGSPTRRAGPFAHGTDRSLHFEAHNLGKKSVTLDLPQSTGQWVFSQLVRHTDVVLDGLGTDAMAGYGLDFPDLAEHHPRLVYVSVTPFGRSSPWHRLASCDLVQMALGGVMASTGYDAEDLPGAPPICPLDGHSLYMGGVFAATGTLAALLRRELTGKGDLVDIALHDCVSVTTEMAVPAWEFQGQIVRRHTGRHSSVHEHTPRWIVPCRDGRYILALTMYLTNDRFREMVEWFAAEGLEDDLTSPHYKNETYRAEHMDHIVDVIAAFCRHHDSGWLFHQAQQRRLPWSAVNNIDDLPGDPHLTERGTFRRTEGTDGAADWAHPGPGYLASGLLRRPLTPAPRLGEHTIEILGELAGLQHERISMLRAAGAI